MMSSGPEIACDRHGTLAILRGKPVLEGDATRFAPGQQPWPHDRMVDAAAGRDIRARPRQRGGLGFRGATFEQAGFKLHGNGIRRIVALS